MASRLVRTVPLLAALILTVLAGDRTAYAPFLAPTEGGYAATRAPRAALTVDVDHTARPATMQAELDRCDGPVAIRLARMRPVLLAEHDYCGGRWILGLEPGQVIRLGGGAVGGTYRVSDDIEVVAKGTSAAVIRGMGDVVAQTCRPDGETLRLVGLARID